MYLGAVFGTEPVILICPDDDPVEVFRFFPVFTVFVIFAVEAILLEVGIVIFLLWYLHAPSKNCRENLFCLFTGFACAS